MHYWGDEDFDWGALDEAGGYLYWFFKIFRLPVMQIKEKFGTLRCYCYLGWSSPHSIAHPNSPYSRWPQDMWMLSCRLARTWIWRNLVYKPSQRFHAIIYRWGYKRIVRKYPHIRKEILEAADYPQLLQGL